MKIFIENKLNIVCVVLFFLCLFSLNAMEEREDGSRNPRNLIEQACNQNEYRAIYMQLFNERDGLVCEALKGKRRKCQKSYDYYTKELMRLLKPEEKFFDLNSEINIGDEDQDEKDCTTENEIIKKNCQKKQKELISQIDRITDLLQQFNTRDVGFDREWEVVDEEEDDETILQLTLQERQFLYDQEEQLKKNPESFYSKYKLDRLSATERYNLIKQYKEESWNRKIKIALGVGVGVFFVGSLVYLAGDMGREIRDLELLLEVKEKQLRQFWKISKKRK